MVEQITRDGIGIVPSLFAAPLIDEVASFAHDAVKASNGQYRAFGGADVLPGFLLSEMESAAWFHELCQGVYRELTGKVPPTPRFFKILRCLSGRTGRNNSNYFHYDSYLLTLLVPVSIPQGRERGGLFLLPNIRPVRRSYLVNAIEKSILDRKWAQRLIRSRASKDPRCLRVDLEPGNLYVFCGYRSLHANEPSAEHDVRATLLFHYANPHEESAFRRVFRKKGRQ